MVHTQARRIFHALALCAALTGVVATSALATVGGSGDTVLSFDGTVQHRVQHQAASPVNLPDTPAVSPTWQAVVQVHTYDLVLSNPGGFVLEIGNGIAPLPVRMENVATRVGTPVREIDVPWYYIMDDREVAPYYLLFWDTSTGWYTDLASDAYRSSVGSLAPPDTPDATSAAQGVPNVRLQTAVREIDVGASVEVLLHSALASASGASYTRGVSIAPTVAGVFAPDDAANSATPLVWASSAPPGAATGAADAPLTGPPLPAQTLSTIPILSATPAQLAVAGAAGLLFGFALYHLIRKSAILKNRVRSAISDHVLHQPGSTITEIAEAVGVTHQTASYHLRLLQEHGLVLGVERGNKRLYFRNDGTFNNEERGLVAVLRDPESMRVLELIRTNPWIMKNEAAVALGVSRNTLNWHLQKLLAAGLVSEARENGHCFLFCNRRASGELLGTVAQKVQEKQVPGAPGEGQAPPPLAAEGLQGAVVAAPRLVPLGGVTDGEPLRR